MKTVEIRHGCYTAEICGTLDHHTCGSPDACNKVKANGVVCTFGTLTRTVFHEASDVVSEAAEMEAALEAIDGHKATAAEKAAIRVATASGKNILSPEAEQAARDHGKTHGVANRSLHDNNPEIFGHE